jgi:hypothetical protein
MLLAFCCSCEVAADTVLITRFGYEHSRATRAALEAYQGGPRGLPRLRTSCDRADD